MRHGHFDHEDWKDYRRLLLKIKPRRINTITRWGKFHVFNGTDKQWGMAMEVFYKVVPERAFALYAIQLSWGKKRL